MRRRSPACVWITALSLLVTACGGPPPPRHPAGATDPNAQVSDDAFPAALVNYLLAKPGSSERQKRAPAVVGRQVARSADQFRARTADRALASFVGAQLLLRLGELSPKVLGPRGNEALRAVVREYAKRGVEGPSHALYTLLQQRGAGAEQADAKSHLQALEQWQASQQKSRGPVGRASAQAELATYAYWFQLDESSRVDAEQKLGTWLKEAARLRDAYRGDARMPARDEGSEAVRAFTVGPLLLAGLYLRDADPQGALHALSRARMRSILRPELLGLIDEVADSPSAENWLRLGTALRTGAREVSEDEELMVLRGVSFVAAVEAYRAMPTELDTAVLLALSLRDFGMDEAVPFLVYPAVKAQPSARSLSVALSLGFEAMATHGDLDEIANARRIYQGMAPILKIAEQTPAGALEPSPARLAALMGNLELRDGNPEAARDLLLASAALEPSAFTELVLAKLARHAKDEQEALRRVRAAASREDAQRDPLLRAELAIFEGDVLRAHDHAAASDAYMVAARILFALPEVDGGVAVRRARLVADVYDRFGHGARADRALARATEAAGKDRGLVSALISQRVARAFAHGDAQAARAAFELGLAYDAESADLVYSATWLRLSERGAQSLDRYFSPWWGSSRWVGRIAEHSAGRRSAASLVSVAKTGAERCEAHFYAAHALLLRGDKDGARRELQQAVATGALSLVEYEFASTALAPPPVLSAPAELDRIDGTAAAREAEEAARKAAEEAAKKVKKKRRAPKR